MILLCLKLSGTIVPYADQQDIINRCDVRTLGDLLSDDNTRLDPSSVLSSTLLNTLLLAASGFIELATYAGQRYSVLDLQALPDPSGQLELLKDLVCARCLQTLIRRRPHVIAKTPEWVTEALVLLNQLRQGERIFGFLQSAQAGMNVERLFDYCLVSDIATSWLGGCCGCLIPQQAGSGCPCSTGGDSCCP